MSDVTVHILAYLLSFSIIILNTDLHNENIKPNRRMNMSDFIRNNKNYGKDISDGDLPEEYLERIYRCGSKYYSIRVLMFLTLLLLHIDD